MIYKSENLVGKCKGDSDEFQALSRLLQGNESDLVLLDDAERDLIIARTIIWGKQNHCENGFLNGIILPEILVVKLELSLSIFYCSLYREVSNQIEVVFYISLKYDYMGYTL